MQARRRPLAFVACLTALTAAGLLYANRELAGDLFWLLAAGRHVDVHGVTGADPFLTIAHGHHWYNQQWLSEWLIFRLEQLGGLQLVSLAYALLLASALAPLAWACRGRALGPTLGAWLLFSGAAVCVLQPRAAGFSMLAFALVVVIVQASARRRRVLLLLPPLRAVGEPARRIRRRTSTAGPARAGGCDRASAVAGSRGHCRRRRVCTRTHAARPGADRLHAGDRVEPCAPAAHERMAADV